MFNWGVKCKVPTRDYMYANGVNIFFLFVSYIVISLYIVTCNIYFSCVYKAAHTNCENLILKHFCFLLQLLKLNGIRIMQLYLLFLVTS